MDVNKLEYFIAVVENGYNITKAAEKLHITQPALSRFICTFEEEENINVFNRKNNRLIGLTPAGESLIVNAQLILENYDTMVEEFRGYSSKIRGSVRMGIPPLVQTVLSAKIMAQLVTDNLDIEYQMYEGGAFELRNKLLLDELDLALLLTPTNLNELTYKETSIYKDELTAFISDDHPLSEKKLLKWTDLNGANLAIYDDSFMVRRLLNKKFKANNIKPNLMIESKSWDFMLELVRNDNFITILPSPIANHALMVNINEIGFVNPIIWEVVIAYPVKKYYNRAEIYAREKILDCFLG